MKDDRDANNLVILRKKGEKINMQFHTLKEMIDSIQERDFTYECFNMRLKGEYRKVSYGDLQDNIRFLANILLKMGVKKQDKIGIISENRFEWPVVYLGVACTGAITVPLDIFMTSEELNAAIEAGDVKIIFTSVRCIEKITEAQIRYIICFDRYKKSNNTAGIEKKEYDKKLPFGEYKYIYYSALLNAGKLLFKNGTDLYAKTEVKPDDTAVMISMNKNIFAVLSHKALMTNAYGTVNRLSGDGRYMKPMEKWLAGLPFHHTYPLMFGVLVPIITRGNTTILTRFKTKDIVNTFLDSKISYMAGVPLNIENIFKELESKKISLPDIKFLMSGGAGLPAYITDRMNQLGITVVQGYGLTEYSPVVSFESVNLNKSGSVGPALCNVDVKIDNPDKNGNGELLIKGPSMMKEYYKRPDLTKEVINNDGWLHTGDIARIDDDGFIWIIGRSKNVIVNNGGKNIYPEEVQQALIKSDYILSALVIPKINPEIGEYAHAFIYPDFSNILKTEKQRFSEQKIKEIIADEITKTMKKMSHYKIPADFEVVHRDFRKTSEPFMFEYTYNTLHAEAGFEDNAGTEQGSVLQQKIEEYICRYIAAISSTESSDIDIDTYFLDLLDSMEILKAANLIEQDVTIKLHPTLLFEYNTIRKFAQYLVTKFEKKFRDYFGAKNPAAEKKESIAASEERIKRGDYLFQQASVEDIDKILELERPIWGKQAAARNMLESRIKIFPEGQRLVFTQDGQLTGYTGYLRTDSLFNSKKTWNQVTDNGTIRKTHKPDGKYIFQITFTALPDYPGIGSLLLSADLEFYMQQNIIGAFVGARVPGYSKAASKYSVEEWVYGKNGISFDPLLRYYQESEAVIIHCIPNFFTDLLSNNYGVLMYLPLPYSAYNFLQSNNNQRFPLTRVESQPTSTVWFSS